jgi:hypothetical protein
MEAAERERAALSAQLDTLSKQLAANADAQRAQDAAMAKLRAEVDKVRARFARPFLPFLDERGAILSADRGGEDGNGGGIQAAP